MVYKHMFLDRENIIFPMGTILWVCLWLLRKVNLVGLLISKVTCDFCAEL